MLPQLMLPADALIRILIQLSAEEGEPTPEQPNGSPCEVIYASTFTLSDRGMVLEITEAIIDQMVTNFNALGESGRIPISVNHRTGAGTLEEARAVGWIVRLYKKVVGNRISLMMEPRWLDDARAAIEGEQFRFLSAGLMLRDRNIATGEEIGAHVREVSLTNTPAIPGLEPITLTALNSAEKIALSVQAVLASGPMAAGVDLAEAGMLPNSLKGRVECVTRSFYSAYPDTNEQVWVMRDCSTDLCIVSRRNREGERIWQLGYSMNQSGGCDFQPMNQWTEVRQVYVPVTQPASMTGAESDVELAAKKGKGKKKPADDGDGPDTEMPSEGMEPRGRMGKMVKTCNEAKQRVAALSARVDELIELRNYARDSHGRFASGGGSAGMGGAKRGKGGWRKKSVPGSSTVKKHYAAKAAAQKKMSPADRKASRGKWKKTGVSKSSAAKELRAAKKHFNEAHVRSVAAYDRGKQKDVYSPEVHAASKRLDAARAMARKAGIR